MKKRVEFQISVCLFSSWIPVEKRRSTNVINVVLVRNHTNSIDLPLFTTTRTECTRFRIFIEVGSVIARVKPTCTRNPVGVFRRISANTTVCGYVWGGGKGEINSHRSPRDMQNIHVYYRFYHRLLFVWKKSRDGNALSCSSRVNKTVCEKFVFVNSIRTTWSTRFRGPLVNSIIITFADDKYTRRRKKHRLANER